MEVFLSFLSENFREYRIILAMDNASWHSSKTHIDNIIPLFQPAYSPEVNPAERVWKHIRENGGFKNRTFDTLAEVEQCLCEAVNNILDRQTVKSLTGFNWIMKTVIG